MMDWKGRSQAEIAKERATYAHSTSTQNQGGKDFACSYGDAPMFRDRQLNREPHADTVKETAPASTPLFRTVRVEHVHYRSTDKDD